MDVHDMPFDAASFDQIFTSCTFCSVPRPVHGLAALHEVLKPGGELHMFEHTGSRYYPFRLMLNLMTPLSRKFGPEMNRPTVESVKAAGFRARTGRPHLSRRGEDHPRQTGRLMRSEALRRRGAGSSRACRLLQLRARPGALRGCLCFDSVMQRRCEAGRRMLVKLGSSP